MIIEKLSFHHKSILEHQFKNIQPVLSEYSFANLFLFRKMHDYEVISENNEVFIVGKTYDGLRHIMPTVDPYKNDMNFLISLAKNYDCIFPVPEEWLKALNGHAEYKENDSDYVYTTDQLSTYKGHNLHGQKNLLNQFMSLYTPQVHPLNTSQMSNARLILDAWQNDIKENKESLDYYPCSEALEMYDDLNLCGEIYFVDEAPAGFVIGEEINDKMFVIHFAKGKRTFKGIYQYMYNHFAKALSKYQYINFEQDMGNLALKIAKSSYHPVKILKKYRLYI